MTSAFDFCVYDDDNNNDDIVFFHDDNNNELSTTVAWSSMKKNEEEHEEISWVNVDINKSIQDDEDECTSMNFDKEFLNQVFS